MARPRIQIDWDTFDKLCAIQCSRREIAAFFGCSEDTIERAVKRTHKITFEAHVATKRQAGLVSLRRKQFEVALSGNRTMLIWLGKQYLGQKDRSEVDTRDLTIEDVIREATGTGPSDGDRAPE